VRGSLLGKNGNNLSGNAVNFSATPSMSETIADTFYPWRPWRLDGSTSLLFVALDWHFVAVVAAPETKFEGNCRRRHKKKQDCRRRRQSYR
jgi:hypothetical protein